MQRPSLRTLSAWPTSLIGLILLAACNEPSLVRPNTAADAKIQAAWTVLGENGQAVVRVITADSTCPSLIQNGIEKSMSIRAGAATIAQRPTESSSEDSKPSAFPVLTCEAFLDTNVRSASVAGRSLPLPKSEPKRIVVLADTGCRIKKADDAYQACNDVTDWPLKTISDSAAAFKPDLVIHIGDYDYRENACPGGNSGCVGSPWGYGWDTWNADLFKPAASLLNAAPWIMVRGNHESCARGGQGWWRFLDPRTLQPGRDCNAAENDVNGDYSDPYAVPIGGDAQLIVFDSSKVPSKPLARTDSAYRIYMHQFNMVNRLADNAGFNIFLDHHPILGFAPVKKKNSSIDVKPGNPVLQALMQEINAKRLFPKSVQVAMSGHVHLFQAIGFSSDHPAQFVAGNGGSQNDIGLPDTLPVGATPFPEAVVDSFNTTKTYGYMTMERLDRQWLIKSWDRDGRLMTSCVFENRHTVCTR